MRYLDVVHRLAAGQLGLVTYAQLRGAHVPQHSVRHLRERGALIEVRHHVYAVAGAPASHERTILAAVLAAGEGAFASHETGAQHWGLPLPGPAALEVTTVYERCPAIPGVRLHRSGLLGEDDVRTLRSIRVAMPELIIVELSSRHSVPDLGKMADEAVRLGITTLGRIRATSARLGRVPGRSEKKIALMLERRIPGTELRESVLEDFVFDSLRRFELPLPVPQFEVTLHGRRRPVDLCYVEERLALEAKGFGFRRSRTSLDAEALRGNELLLANFRVLSVTAAFTDWQIAQQVAEALRCAPPSPMPPLTFEEWKALR